MPVLDDDALRERGLAGLAHFQRLLGLHVPGARAIEGSGWVGSVVPGSPRISLVNAVVARHGAAVVADLGAIRDHYGDEIKWGVWVAGGDHATREALESAGLVLDSRPLAQAARLEDIAALDDPVEAERVDGATLAGVNEEAWGVAAGTFAGSIAHLPADSCRAFGVRHEGDVAAVAACLPHAGDAHVTCVATRPAARRRGLGARALVAALRDARAAGCTITTLEASAAGAPVYRRLGYRDVGEVALYERRPGAGG